MKEKILDTAASLILQYGLKKFTMNDIAAALKISKKTIYQYFSGKDDIIRAYFEAALTSDKDGITAALSQNIDIAQKIHAIVYSSHRYRLSVSLLSEAKQFYPEVWVKVEDLKKFKLEATQNLLKEGTREGIFKADTNFGVLSKMLERISDMFTDYEYLLNNHLTTREAMDEALKIIFHGIML